jgi:hypothetical protein
MLLAETCFVILWSSLEAVVAVELAFKLVAVAVLVAIWLEPPKHCLELTQ